MQEVFKEMLAVAEINYIRQEVNNKGYGYSDVAKRTRRDPRTVKRIWRTSTNNQKRDKREYHGF